MPTFPRATYDSLVRKFFAREHAARYMRRRPKIPVKELNSQKLPAHLAEDMARSGMNENQYSDWLKGASV